MSMIIYYSNYCEHSKKLIQKISQSQIKDDMHFICIDKRIKKPNGVTNIILENSNASITTQAAEKIYAGIGDPATIDINIISKLLFY